MERRSYRPLISAMAVIAVIGLGALLLVWDPWGANRTATSSASSAAPTSPSSPSNTPAPVALPNEPPPNSGCQGNVIDHSDLEHPTLGTVRVFLLRDSSAGAGCVLPVTESGRVLPAIPIDDRGKLGFANPGVDATGNVFITYNPGRYDGVLVLIPDAQGFEDIGWDPDMSGTHYVGKHAYYYAELLAPNDRGEYTIRQSQNDCVPGCATGTVTATDLHWNGSDYVP
jgi:hypothetical protein